MKHAQPLNKHVCAVCFNYFKNKHDRTIDHIFPRSKANPERMNNTPHARVNICFSCNQKKGDIENRILSNLVVQKRKDDIRYKTIIDKANASGHVKGFLYGDGRYEFEADFESFVEFWIKEWHFYFTNTFLYDYDSMECFDLSGDRIALIKYLKNVFNPKAIFSHYTDDYQIELYCLEDGRFAYAFTIYNCLVGLCLYKNPPL